MTCKRLCRHDVIWILTKAYRFQLNLLIAKLRYVNEIMIHPIYTTIRQIGNLPRRIPNRGWVAKLIWCFCASILLILMASSAQLLYLWTQVIYTLIPERYSYSCRLNMNKSLKLNRKEWHVHLKHVFNASWEVFVVG